MRLPFCNECTLQGLSGGAIKALFLLASRKKPGYLVLGLLVDDCRLIGVTPSTCRKYLDELLVVGLITELKVTTAGYVARVAVPRRFTWVPSFQDERLMRLTPQACKAFYTICRAASNKTRTIRMKLTTLAKRVGRAVRSVQLCLLELRDHGLVDSIRTGRSNIFRLAEPETQHDLPFSDCIAHRCRTLLRIVESTPLPLLAKTLGKMRRRAHGAYLGLFNSAAEAFRGEETSLVPILSTIPQSQISKRDLQAMQSEGISAIEIMEAFNRTKHLHSSDIARKTRAAALVGC